MVLDEQRRQDRWLRKPPATHRARETDHPAIAGTLVQLTRRRSGLPVPPVIGAGASDDRQKRIGPGHDRRGSRDGPQITLTGFVQARWRDDVAALTPDVDAVEAVELCGVRHVVGVGEIEMEPAAAGAHG